MTSPGFTYPGTRGTQVACDVCGRQLSVRLDGTARVHTRCPNRPEETT